MDDFGEFVFTLFFFTSFLLNKVNTSIAVSQENIRIKKNSSNVQYLDFFFFVFHSLFIMHQKISVLQVAVSSVQYSEYLTWMI